MSAAKPSVDAVLAAASRELTIPKAFALLRELDWYSGNRSGTGCGTIGAVEKTRAALAEHIASYLESGGRTRKRGAR